jgi:hypothetical protein
MSDTPLDVRGLIIVTPDLRAGIVAGGVALDSGDQWRVLLETGEQRTVRADSVLVIDAERTGELRELLTGDDPNEGLPVDERTADDLR